MGNDILRMYFLLNKFTLSKMLIFKRVEQYLSLLL
jgi:hypothetical protein